MDARIAEIDTPQGLARAHVHAVDDPVAALVLGHGAGGSVTAPDLQAVTRAAVAARHAVVLVEQPYRVAGRRSPPRAPALDTAWCAVVDHLREHDVAGVPLVTGGRSSGARVACRTAEATGARAVLCLAFPLVAPNGTSRQEELDAVAVPVLVVQGTTDRFGMPRAAGLREVAEVPGDHGLKKDVAGIAALVVDWLQRVERPPYW
ncbi:MAG: alpha/beta hydrolase [Solirubrobacterales bacterium]|nr:alpha/beta hydrolase [Solirubrobacterales bacterium]